ncbi:MFS transporter [Microbacterium sp. A8/3-1]|uniref:MFS transporter n=1 Tax=Microbacterium sp. A8/3-1 TaxID=3160749 RepID=A0AAU7VYY2_9MICO
MSTTTPRAERRLTRKNSPDRLSAGTTLAWTTTGISAAVFVVLSGYFTFYGTNVLGLPAAVIGTIVLLGTLLSAAGVVVAGWLVDRSPETRWGKARPYELAIVGVWAAAYMLFSTPDFDHTGKAIWLFVAYSLANVVFISLLGANDVLYMARAFRGRVLFTKVSTRTGFLTVLGVVAFNVVLPLLVSQAGESAPAWSTTVLFIALPMAVLGLGRFIFVKEKYQTEAADAPRITFRDIREVLGNNRYLWIVAGISLVSAIASAPTVTVYFFNYVVGDIALMSLVAVVPIIVLPIMLAFPWLMRKIGASRIITYGAIGGVVGGVVMSLSGGNLALVFVATILSGVGILPITFLTGVLIIDNAAYNQWSGRRRLESTMGAITNFCLRVGAGVAVGISGWVLGLAGYDGNLDKQADSAITAIVLFAGAVPALLWVGVIIVMQRYRRLELMLPTITEELSAILADDPDVDAPAVEIVPGVDTASAAPESAARVEAASHDGDLAHEPKQI